MGNTIIKSLAEEVQVTSSTTLYRIGNLRVLHVDGVPPHQQILAVEDRPKYDVHGCAICNTSDGNLYCAVGRINIGKSGVIGCVVATTYYSGGSGYSTFVNGVMAGNVIWTV